MHKPHDPPRQKALWAVNFMIVANDKQYAGLHHLAMLLPATGVFLFNALSVKTSSLLLAISAMDPEIIGKVRAHAWRARFVSLSTKALLIIRCGVLSFCTVLANASIISVRLPAGLRRVAYCT